MGATEDANFDLFREILSTPLIAKSSSSPTQKRKARGRKTEIKRVESPTVGERDDAAELGEFIDYVTTEIFNSLPEDLRTLTYSAWLNTPSLKSKYTTTLELHTSTSIIATLSPSIADTLHTYSFLTPHQTLSEFLFPILSSYVSTILTPPPPPSSTKEFATECEICQREHIPLTYHHLIPRSVHTKVLKRGWHTEDKLNDVAWLCRACHSFVHSCASNEELAREWWSVERLMERGDVQGFAKWVGGVRWKKR